MPFSPDLSDVNLLKGVFSQNLPGRGTPVLATVLLHCSTQDSREHALIVRGPLQSAVDTFCILLSLLQPYKVGTRNIFMIGIEKLSL